MKKSLLYTCLLGLGTLTLTSCSEIEEITEVIYGRIFSPTDLEVKNIKENSADIVWNASKGANEYFIEVYEDDSLTFEGAPIISTPIENNSRHLELLTYDTDYSVRVYAKNTEDGSRNSKPSEVYFHTSAQQILNSIKEDDILDRSVSVSWPEEEKAVSRIIISDYETGEEVATHEITDAEREVAKASVEGLNPETKYSVKLYYVANGIQKERGSKTFTTIVDLNGAIIVSPEDNIQSIIRDAKDGDVFALKPGKFVVKSSSDDESITAGSVVVSKNVTIKGIYPTKIPTINGRFEIQDGATLEISQVNLDGKGTSGDQCFNVKGTQVGGIKVSNSEIKNYVKGVYYVNVAAKIPYITFENCLIHNITCEGGDMFDCRKGCIETLTFSKSTIYASCAARDFIRYDDAAASFDNAPSVIKVDQCTIDAAANASGKRLLYVRYGGKNDPKSTSIIWTNNLVTNTVGVWSNQASTPTPDFGLNNVYSGCTKLNVLDGAEGGKTNLFIDEKGTTADPKYKNAEEGDFTITNESVSKLKVGDPRWY